MTHPLLDTHFGRYSPQSAATAFEWLRKVSTADGAPPEAGIALDLWNAAIAAARSKMIDAQPEQKADWSDRRTDSLEGWVNELLTLSEHHDPIPSFVRSAMQVIARGLLATLWRPIATAPKDATNVLLRSGNYATVGHWHPRGFWCSNGPVYAPYRENEQPTTWMPIPP